MCSAESEVHLPKVLQVRVLVFVLQQLTLDEVITQVELRHGQYLSFVGRGVAGRVHQVIPELPAEAAVAAGEQREKWHRGVSGDQV